ncbi:MAG: glucose-6-phosphate dehydrogenase assembly protein OpcA [Geodermatophilaceae bacterium]|nr:glucose-6-phosphate dehydrogenase assembly protein OpcA [Geodermatophilaceae bacterium]
MSTLWDTTGTEVVKALGAARRNGAAVTSGLALTFVVVAEEREVEMAEQAATAAAAMHPCRLVMVVRRDNTAPTPRLDAEVSVGGRLGPGEAVQLRMYGRLALHAESVVLPLLAPDAPVVTWWPGKAPDRLATDGLGVLAERRVTDCSLHGNALEALHIRAADYAPGDTDLAWTRITSWRSMLAAAVDSAGSPGSGVTVTGARVYGQPDSASAALLAGWLSSRLYKTVKVVESDAKAPERGGAPDAAGVTGARLDLAGTDPIYIAHREGVGMVRRAGRPESSAALTERDFGELLGEELRRLDADESYCEALAAATNTRGLDTRPPTRALIWEDPAAATDKPSAKEPTQAASSKSSRA